MPQSCFVTAACGQELTLRIALWSKRLDVLTSLGKPLSLSRLPPKTVTMSDAALLKLGNLAKAPGIVILTSLLLRLDRRECLNS